MPYTIRFFLRLSSDHQSPAVTDTPTVLIWSGGSWNPTAQAATGIGDGLWSVSILGSEYSGGDPVLGYALSAESDPEPLLAYPNGTYPVAGTSSVPLPFWMGTTSSSGYQPATGLSPSASISVNGAAFAPGAGTVIEPGGAGEGHGWYLYYPGAAELAAGDAALFATATGAVGWSWDYTIGAAPATPSPPPTVPVASPSSIPMGRGRDVRNDIAARLSGTGLFSAVRLASPDEITIPGSDFAAVAIEPGPWKEIDRWDDGFGEDITIVAEERAVVTVLVRNSDPQIRDELAEQLVQAVKDAVDGQSLGLITMPDFTRAAEGRPLPARASERRHVVAVVFQYLVQNWAGHDESP